MLELWIISSLLIPIPTIFALASMFREALAAFAARFFVLLLPAIIGTITWRHLRD